MFFQEAKQILDVKDLSNLTDIEEKYKKLFEMNDKTKGGSFYLQSKVTLQSKFLQKISQNLI
jgi:import inner membrane translocase subunit TIM16